MYTKISWLPGIIFSVYFRFVDKPISNHPPTHLTIRSLKTVSANHLKELPNVLPKGNPFALHMLYDKFICRDDARIIRAL